LAPYGIAPQAGVEVCRRGFSVRAAVLRGLAAALVTGGCAELYPARAPMCRQRMKERTGFEMMG
jgi:hypothetical protein